MSRTASEQSDLEEHKEIAHSVIEDFQDRWGKEPTLDLIDYMVSYYLRRKEQRKC